jgi:hypothetical protein
VELAAVVAVNGRLFIRHGRISQSALEQYWSHSKFRLDRWSQSLKEYGQLQQSNPPYVSQEAALILAWRGIRPVIEEILVSEILTRVWSSVASAYDHHHGSAEVTAVVRSVYLGHQEARNRALNLMVYGRGFNTQEAVELNRLRRRCERWCDMLLGYVAQTGMVEEYAFEPNRTADFARDLRDEYSHSLNSFGWQIVLSSLRAAFQMDRTESPNLQHNSKISSAILGCYRGDAFDSLGVLKSLWIERIQHLADDTEGMLDQLLSLEPSLSSVGESSVLSERFQRK